MRRHALTKVLPYTPDQLFQLVGDIARYPEFVPWLTSMRTWNEQALEAGVGISIIRERFTTRVLRDANQRLIAVSLIRGPFRALNNSWLFRPHPGGTLIEFSIDFEFKSRLLDTILAANARHAADRLIGCFEGRAKRLYGSAMSGSATPAPADGAA